MASDNTQSPATKQDIAMLMEEIGKLYDANQRWKDEIIQKTVSKQEWRVELDALRLEMKAQNSKMFDEFRLVAEDLRHELFGITKDRLEGHEERIVRLERHTKLVAA